jgi:hypothetical protein
MQMGDPKQTHTQSEKREGSHVAAHYWATSTCQCHATTLHFGDLMPQHSISFILYYNYIHPCHPRLIKQIEYYFFSK